MPVKRKPRCFVAMAFDREDTNLLYEQAIRPVLRKSGIIPVIINRREDNRDINHQIIEQLEASDFCITDLTYARPSVYFEAGYAQREVEVIYTVRSDHLRKDQPDDFRVHFDLQMKPLIEWATPEDSSFPNRLERRIRATFLREWNRVRQEEVEQQKQRAQFSHMPLAERLTNLRRAAVASAHELGFSVWTALQGIHQLPKEISYREILTQLGYRSWMMSEKREGGCFE